MTLKSSSAGSEILMFKARLTKAIEWYKNFEQIARRIISKSPFLSEVNQICNNIKLAKANK